MPVRAQRIVRETAAAYAAAPKLQLTEERRWCAVVDDDGCDFKSVAYVVAMDDGGIIASDYRGPIRRFDARGAFASELSRRGAGPGEYRYVHALQVHATAQLRWYDPVLRRVTSVELSSGRAGPVVGASPPLRLAGAYLVGADLVVFEIPPASVPGGEVSASFRTAPADAAPRILAAVRRSSWYVDGSPVPQLPPLFTAGVVADVSAAGDVAHASERAYALSVFPTRGAAWQLLVAIPPRPVLKADRDSAIAEELKDESVTTIAALSPAIQQRIRDARTTFPAIEEVRVLRDGTVWIRPTIGRGAALARWDVFTREGERLGYAELPRTATIKDGTRDWVLVVTLQADDLPSVLRYRVAK